MTYITSMSTLLLMVVCAPFAILGQTVSEVSYNVPGNTFRIALLSDTHLIGPEYIIGSEGSENDNLSVLKTQQRLYQAFDIISNKITPKPALTVFGGDVVHDGLHADKDLDHYLNVYVLPHASGLCKWHKYENGDSCFVSLYVGFTGYNIASALFDKLTTPYHLTWGNHDYSVSCGSPAKSFPKNWTWDIQSHFFNQTSYTAVNIGGWKYLLLDGQLGYTWDPTDPRCFSRYGTYGAEQLTWLDEQLSEGKPTIIHTHYPLPNTGMNETADSPYPDLLSTLLAHNDTVKLFLSGHAHKGFNWEDLYPFPTYTLPGMRYDVDNFFLIELTQNSGQFKFLDFIGKNKNGARCSYTYMYNGTVAQADNQKETGDCGVPTVNETATYQLGPINTAADVPSTFEPEAVCPIALIDPFLKPCAPALTAQTADNKNATSDCCQLWGNIFRPSSGQPFNTCLCIPSFYKAVAQKVKAMGGQLSTMLKTCTTEYKQTFGYLGTNACQTPNYPAPL